MGVKLHCQTLHRAPLLRVGPRQYPRQKAPHSLLALGGVISAIVLLLRTDHNVHTFPAQQGLCHFLKRGGRQNSLCTVHDGVGLQRKPDIPSRGPGPLGIRQRRQGLVNFRGRAQCIQFRPTVQPIHRRSTCHVCQDACSHRGLSLSRQGFVLDSVPALCHQLRCLCPLPWRRADRHHCPLLLHEWKPSHGRPDQCPLTATRTRGSWALGEAQNRSGERIGLQAPQDWQVGERHMSFMTTFQANPVGPVHAGSCI